MILAGLAFNLMFCHGERWKSRQLLALFLVKDDLTFLPAFLFFPLQIENLLGFVRRKNKLHLEILRNWILG